MCEFLTVQRVGTPNSNIVQRSIIIYYNENLKKGKLTEAAACNVAGVLGKASQRRQFLSTEAAHQTGKRENEIQGIGKN